MVLTIYAPLFASSKRAVVTLVEKGVEFETVNVDLMKGEQRKPEYLAIQVRSSSPILIFFFNLLIYFPGDFFDLYIFFRSMQPFGKIPVLVDGGYKIFGTHTLFDPDFDITIVL